MQQALKAQNQKGFSIIEMMIALTVMLVITAAVLSLVKSSMKIASATYELTDAQENLRIAQEYINRDLMNAGDGLKSMTYLPVRTTFVQDFLSRSPIADTTMPTGVTNLGILTTDNNVPANTVVKTVTTTPVVKVLEQSDRQTILAIDPDPSNIQVVPSSITSDGGVITLPTGTDMSRFTVGEIHFLTSTRGGTFAAITAIDSSQRKLTFANNDFCGLNLVGTNGRIKDISLSGTIPTALQRMRIIHYYIDADKVLKRRVFGEKGAAFRDTIIAEHIAGVQFVYSLGLDSDGNPVQPTSQLTTPQEQVAISQVEVTVTAETPKNVTNNLKTLLSSVTSTSLRNMQFRQALQPKANP